MSKLNTQAVTLRSQAQALQVVDASTYLQAGEFLKTIATMIKTITAHYKPLKQAVDESKKKILAQEKADLEPVQLADGLVRQQVTAYLDAEEKKRKAEEDRLLRESEANAEKERNKLLNRAANAEGKGQLGKAEVLLDQAENVYAAPVTVDHAVDKTINGVTRKTDTVVTVQALVTFLTAMIERNPGALPGMLDVRPGALKSFVKANGLKSFPGLIIEEKSSIAVRS